MVLAPCLAPPTEAPVALPGDIYDRALPDGAAKKRNAGRNAISPVDSEEGLADAGIAKQQGQRADFNNPSISQTGSLASKSPARRSRNARFFSPLGMPPTWVQPSHRPRPCSTMAAY